MHYSFTACELPLAGGWIADKAAAPGLRLLRHAQLRHSAAGVVAQAVAQSTRQVLQVGSSLGVCRGATGGPHSGLGIGSTMNK